MFSPISIDLLTSIVIFGADGGALAPSARLAGTALSVAGHRATDLSRKKILPTIFNLWRRKLLPRDFVLFGYAREPLDDERFRRTVFNNIYHPSQPQSDRKEFLTRVHYQAGQFGDPVAIGQLMGRLRDEERARLIERKKASDGPLRQLSEAPEAQPAHQAPEG